MILAVKLSDNITDQLQDEVSHGCCCCRMQQAADAAAPGPADAAMDTAHVVGTSNN